MDRRNFIGSLLVAGAGFFVLPGAGRLWVPERKLIVPTPDSVWEHYYLSTDFLPRMAPPERNPSLGKTVMFRNRLWYGTGIDWRQLRLMSRPLDNTPAANDNHAAICAENPKLASYAALYQALQKYARPARRDDPKPSTNWVISEQPINTQLS